MIGQAAGPPTARINASLSEYYFFQNCNTFNLQLEWRPKSALHLAGQTITRYRRSGGIRSGILADFYIGAHAAVVHLPIVTRDTTRYRTHFPDVELIAPF